MKKYTDITVLVDRSGSMRSIKESMEEALNKFVEEHRHVPSSRFSLIQFDDINDHEIWCSSVPIRKAQRYILHPRGNTPLLDAFCKAIDSTGRRLRGMMEHERPDQVLMVVITDGAENASRQFHRQDVFDRVTHQREAYKWEFVYLGANQDTFYESQSFGIPWVNTITYTPRPEYIGLVGQSMSQNTMSYVNRSSDHVDSFTANQRNGSASVADRASDPVTTIVTNNDNENNGA